MTGNVGVKSTNWVKALVIETVSAGEEGTAATTERVAFITTDSIGSDGSMGDKCWAMAAARGFKITRANTIFSASHTHSGPGALSPEFLWAVAPATDLLIPSLLDFYCERIVAAALEAQENMEPAKIDAGSGILTGVTKNRRAPNPWVNYGTIDPHLGVIRVDRASDGKPLATLWNYAIHVGFILCRISLHFHSPTPRLLSFVPRESHTPTLFLALS
jgi:Neutral/alkaline non-lysosomal ceramidase, N-terminal